MMDIENMLEIIKQKIDDADMILVGLGEEFDCMDVLRQNGTYMETRKELEDLGATWMIPLLNQVYGAEKYQMIQESLQHLADRLKDKNYFVVATSVNDCIRNVAWREKRLVMPCGGAVEKQCSCGCENTVKTLEERNALMNILKDAKHFDAQKIREVLGTCPICGEDMVLNNIYTETYDESGYLEQWNWYMKWLQGTLNKNLLILELGVTMQCPSVIRWPFEKVTFFNQKAYMCRVNEKLYHLAEELKGKGVGISQNAIDWLQLLC